MFNASRSLSALTLACCALLCACEAVKRPNSPVPDEFRALTLTDEVLERSTMQGRPWVISVWRPGCKECLRQLKTLDAVKQKLQSPLVGFVALSLDSDEDAVMAAAGKAEIDSALAIAVGEAMGPLGFRRLPSTAFIDEKGTIVAVCTGECDAATVEKWVRVAAP